MDILWRPFELNPALPPEGMDRQAYRRAKFGSLERSRELEQRVSDAGRPDGIDFAFDRIRRTPNTFHAHRLLARARREGRQDAVAEALFRSYFLEGRDVGDLAVLADLASVASLDPAFLATDAEAGAVRAEERAGLALGIQSVPCFVFNGRLAVSGAQSPDVLRRALLEGPGGPGSGRRST